MTASDYQVTFPYGATSDPYSEAHPHRGDDYPCPSGTPIVIGGTTIGLTGATGWATGPHLHIQEWSGDVATTRKPQNAFGGGTVTASGEASQWGKYITISSGGWNTTYCHLSRIDVGNGTVIGSNNNNGNNGGTGTMNDDTSRQVAFHYLGRHGRDGRPNGLEAPQELQGRPLTNAELSSIFLSAESRQWRDVELPTLFAERDNLRVQVASLNGQVQAAQGDIAAKQATIDEQAKAIEGLQGTVSQQGHEIDNLNAANKELADEVKAKDKRIKELEAQVAAGGTDITINFNNFGLIMWTLIKAAGLKKG